MVGVGWAKNKRAFGLNFFGNIFRFEENMVIRNNGVKGDGILGQEDLFVTMAVIAISGLPGTALNGVRTCPFIGWCCGKAGHHANGVLKSVPLYSNLSHQYKAGANFVRVQADFEILAGWRGLGERNTIFICAHMAGGAVLVGTSMADGAGDILVGHMLGNGTC